MKKLLFILFPVIVQAQVSNIKNIRPISTDSMYESFGWGAMMKVDTVFIWDRVGKTHITDALHPTPGNQFMRKYSISGDTFSDTIRVGSSTKDARDVYGYFMQDSGYVDSAFMFFQYSNNGIGGDWGIDLQVAKCDTNGIFSPPVDFDTTVLPVRLQRRFVYQFIKGDTACYYEGTLVQFNQNVTPARRRISIIATKDRGAHWYEKGVVYDGTGLYSETALGNLGNGKRLALRRLDNSGTLAPCESSNYSSSFIPRVSSNLYHYISAGAEVPHISTHDSLFDIIFECRDASTICISKNNSPSLNWGNAIYNAPEIYAYNQGAGTGGNTSLGYPFIIPIIGDSIKLVIFFKQFNVNRANGMYTRDNFITDPGCIPEAPVITVSNVTTTSFKWEVKNYTDKQKENIRWLNTNLAYDSLFTNIVTCKYRVPTSGAYPAVPIQNIRLIGFWDIYNVLTTGTYWLKVEACNYKGCRATIKKVTL